MKILTLFLALVLPLAGCMTSNPESAVPEKNKIEKTHDQETRRDLLIQDWVGRVGYLMAPPTFKDSSAIRAADPDQFDRCAKVRITKINHAFTDHEFTIFLEQNSKVFAIVGNESDGTAGHSDLWNLTQYFGDQLIAFQPPTVKTVQGDMAARDLACSGKFWKGMNRSELKFVMGPPTGTSAKVESGKNVEQWDYRVPSPGKASAFWFENNELRNWTR
jgi:hypothetical protein